MATYVDALKEKVAHVLTLLSKEEKEELTAKIARNDTNEPEFVAVVASMGKHATFHPAMAITGEQLPEGFVCSCSGFLVNMNVHEVKVNQVIVKKDTLHLQKHAILAYFIGGKQLAQVVSQWLTALQAKVGAWIGLERDLGCGFFQIYTKSLVVTQKVAMLTSHRSRWETCILQTWTPYFNSSKPIGLKVSTWVTLKVVQGEFLGMADQIAARLGEVVGSDKQNAYCTDQRFCVVLTLEEGYRSQLSVTNDCTGLISTIDVDYNSLPIKCRF